MIHKRIPVLVVLLIFVLSLAVPVASANDFAGQTKRAIMVTSPHGSEVWQAGVNRTITWTYTPEVLKGAMVKILLLKDGNVAGIIAPSTSAGRNGYGSYDYNFLNIKAGTYRIKIIGITPDGLAVQNASSGVSNEFTITDQAKISIGSPQGGQVLYSGDQVTISWNYTGDISDTLFLHLVHRSGDTTGNGLFNVVISDKVPVGSGGYGSYNWIVPDVPTGYTYTVQLSTNAAGIGASSQNFTIVNSKHQPTVKLKSPNGGEVWFKGRTYNITWTHVADPGQKVIITLVPSGDPAKFRKIGEAYVGAGGAGTFSWQISADVEPRKDYQIWVTNGVYNPNFLDHSDNNFTVAEMVTVKPNKITTSPVKRKPGDLEKLDPQPEPPMR